ncbi:hypothetical protein IW261DRAFT_1492568 [Armillaria novae-zelandiae]|uniref:T6SS Phospholipase effector Tle1-like catalytic domain-containing protein n=1 Tax=Armillaria novae-zelandiae TaxID=153914 RepID=A0AA39P2D5_9AGAR|nr:hypothetical protein IW261DRAFT_1492568 [Armillaria novae-zelandiae]
MQSPCFLAPLSSRMGQIISLSATPVSADSQTMGQPISTGVTPVSADSQSQSISPSGMPASSDSLTMGQPISTSVTSVSEDFQTTSKPRGCGCKCDTDCNCVCPCKNHCVCLPHTHSQDCDTNRQVKCYKKCGSTPLRNLIVCLDGTSNQFGHRELKGDPDVPQLTFHSGGIGTYAPPLAFSVAHWLRIFDNIIDMAIAWNFRHLVQEAYQWLADHYLPGDRIYHLFGFSRGAYQIRALSGMIEKLGLVFPGN